MTIIRVKGFNIFPDRHGHSQCHHRKTGIAIDLKKAPIGSAEFYAECAKIAAIAEKAAMATEEKPGTLGLLICDYRNSPVFSRSRATNPRRLSRNLRIFAADRRHAPENL